QCGLEVRDLRDRIGHRHAVERLAQQAPTFGRWLARELVKVHRARVYSRRMSDELFRRLFYAATTIARRAPASTWTTATSHTFERDVSCFDWRLGDLLDNLGVRHRSYPSRQYIPGRVALLGEADAVPPRPVIDQFLDRGGTVIVEGTEMLAPLDLVG